MEIDKYSQLPVNVQKALIEAGLELKAGDILVKVDGGYSVDVIRIVKIYFEERKSHNHKYSNTYIKYQKAKDWQATEWSSPSESTLFDFKYHYSKAVRIEGNKSFNELWQEAKDVIAGKIEIDFYRDQGTDSINNENAVMSRHGKESLLAVQQHLESKRKQAELIRVFVGYEMEKKRQELERIREKMYGVVAEFQKKVGKIMRVITTIELYLGIDEELFQIQDGEKASADEPIQFRQMVYFMDEEVGHWKSGGLDWTDIQWFDKWLLENDNYKRLLPEKKGLMVFRPRRYEKDYGRDPAYSASMNRENRYRTYLLIRNGECLYRVYTEKIIILPRLFPKRAELQELLGKLEKEMERDDFWTKRDGKEAAEDLLYQYKKRAILMQGLIDRTEIFHPLKKQISIFKLDQADGLVNFIYDDEATLPSGRKSFKEWKADINSKIQHGSRVVCTGGYGGLRKNWTDRIYYHCNEYNAPNTPAQGIYSVEEYLYQETRSIRESNLQEVLDMLTAKGISYTVKEEGVQRYIRSGVEFSDKKTDYEKGYEVRAKFPHLTILHNPGGETRHGWNDWGHERVKRIRFRIFPTDDAILNYDQISLDDIEFYLTSRVDRPNYLSMMPLLETMREWRLKEMESEKAFADLVFRRNANQGLTDNELKDRVGESIEWWKFKNQWKRPIDKDDTLALRMIEKRIKSKNYNNLRR